jgi:hypothetical protein
MTRQKKGMLREWVCFGCCPWGATARVLAVTKHRPPSLVTWIRTSLPPGPGNSRPLPSVAEWTFRVITMGALDSNAAVAFCGDEGSVEINSIDPSP